MADGLCCCWSNIESGILNFPLNSKPCKGGPKILAFFRLSAEFATNLGFSMVQILDGKLGLLNSLRSRVFELECLERAGLLV